MLVIDLAIQFVLVSNSHSLQGAALKNEFAELLPNVVLIHSGVGEDFELK